MIREYNNSQIYFEQSGSGKNILILHGWGCSVKIMQPLTNELAKHAHVTAVDFPGHGLSPNPPEPWMVDDFAQQIYELIIAENLAPTDIIAHSFGGRVALKLAAHHPELVGNMVLTGCAGLRGKQTFKKKLRARIYKAARAATKLLGSAGENMRERLAKAFGSSDYAALDPNMRATFVKVVNEDLSGILENIKSSVILYWGQEDSETPLWMGEYMSEHIKDSALIKIPNAGHYAFLENFAHFVRVVKSFFNI